MNRKTQLVMSQLMLPSRCLYEIAKRRREIKNSACNVGKEKEQESI